jgi:lipid A 3-O-deacylase
MNKVSIASAVFLLSTACNAAAQTESPQAPRTGVSQSQDRRQTTLIGYTENDDWPPDTGTDKNYTNAFRVTLERNYDMWRLAERLPKLFGWVPQHPNCSVVAPEDNPELKCVSSSWHVIGQQFYTPDDITIAELIPDDRPYAGWLYIGGSWKSSTASTLVATDAYLGATGDASFSREVQTKWHKIVGAKKPMGWDHQIGDRFGVIIGHSRRWARDGTYGPIDEKKWLEFVPYVGATVGNIVIDGYGGARLKIGYNVTRDWADIGVGPRLGQPLLGGASDTGPFEIYFVVDGQGRLLAYNVFIDAASSHLIDRKYFVADGGYGLGIRYKRFSFSYRIAFVTPEYQQTLRHDYKALRFTIPLSSKR